MPERTLNIRSYKNNINEYLHLNNYKNLVRDSAKGISHKTKIIVHQSSLNEEKRIVEIKILQICYKHGSTCIVKPKKTAPYNQQ